MNLIGNISPTLDREQTEMILAKNGKRVDELTREEFTYFLKMLVIKTHLDCGQRADEEMLKLTLPELIADFVNYFSMFTTNQIALAFKLGIDKEFGDYFGLNNKTYRQWMKGFLGSPKRLEANKLQDRYLKELKQPEIKTIPDEEKNKKAFEFIESYFKKEKKPPFIADWSGAFKHLESVKSITDSNEDKRMFMENVVSEIREEINGTAKSKGHREDMLNDWTNEKVINECRKRRVIIYLENYVSPK